MLALLKVIEVANYKIQLDIDLNAHLDLNVKLTKMKFNELCEELCTRTSRLIDDTLRMAGFGTDDIDHIVNNHGNLSFWSEISFLNNLFRYLSVDPQGFPP